MDPFSAALELTPRRYTAALREYAVHSPEELRLRVGRAPSLVWGGGEHFLSAMPIEEEDLLRVLEKATGASLYSAAAAMRQGYFCADSAISVFRAAQYRPAVSSIGTEQKSQ